MAEFLTEIPKQRSVFTVGRGTACLAGRQARRAPTSGGVVTFLGNFWKRRRGFTLVELLVAVSIASIITLSLQQLLETSLTSWRLAVEEAQISRLSEEIMRRMSEGDYDLAGIRDAAELLNVEKTEIAFVPLWLDIFDLIPTDGRFYLSKPARPGSPPPLAQIRFKGEREFRSYLGRVRRDGMKDWVDFGFPIKPGASVRISYQPDPNTNPETAMRIVWNQKAEKIVRYYNKDVTELNMRREHIRATAVDLTYYDGGNGEVDTTGRKYSKDSALARISAVKIKVVLRGSDLEREAVSFVNIRALGKGGQGIILSDGLEIPVPDSQTVQLLNLANFMGVEEGDKIELKIAAPKVSAQWRIKLFLGLEEGDSVLRRFEIYYPAKKLVMEREDTVSLKYGINLLTLDEDGIYDYDIDEGEVNRVQFKGDNVVLSVIKSDPEGVMLIVRP